MRLFLKDYIKHSAKFAFQDLSDAKWAIIYIIAYFVFCSKFLYSSCLVVLITGFPCPTCGMTRAAFKLLNGCFVEAFKMQPFIYPIIVLFVLFGINRYILLKKTPEYMKWFLILIILGLIGFYIWRMYMFFPDVPPMTYYSGNLVSKLAELVKVVKCSLL